MPQFVCSKEKAKSVQVILRASDQPQLPRDVLVHRPIGILYPYEATLIDRELQEQGAIVRVLRVPVRRRKGIQQEL